MILATRERLSSRDLGVNRVSFLRQSRHALLLVSLDWTPVSLCSLQSSSNSKSIFQLPPLCTALLAPAATPAIYWPLAEDKQIFLSRPSLCLCPLHLHNRIRHLDTPGDLKPAAPSSTFLPETGSSLLWRGLPSTLSSTDSGSTSLYSLYCPSFLTFSSNCMIPHFHLNYQNKPKIIVCCIAHK